MARREDQAVAFANAGRVDLAERLLRDQLRETPLNAEAHRLMAHCLRVRGLLPMALAAADEALRLSPDSGLCHLERGRALRALKRLNEAEAEMREAIALDPGAPSMLGALARVLVDRGSLEQAIVAARAGLEIDPCNHDCLCVLGLALLRSHRADEAHQIYRDALADEPSRAHLHNDLGVALLHLGDRISAGVEFREALRLDPRLTSAETNLGLAGLVFVVSAHPYTLRFASAWRHLKVAARVFTLAGLLALGVVWPGGWGALAYPLGLEARRLAATTGRSGATAFNTAAIGTIGLAFLVLASLSPTHVVHGALATDSSSGFDPRLLAEWWQLITGVAVFRAAMPAGVTSGRVRRVAIAVVGVAVLAAVWGAHPGAGAEAAAAGMFVALACAVSSGRLVFRYERATSRFPWSALDAEAEPGSG